MPTNAQIRDRLQANVATLRVGDVAPTTFVRDGVLHVSAEDGGYFADYYGEYRGGFPWIDPRLEAAAKTQGMFWEWQNAGCIAAYHA